MAKRKNHEVHADSGRLPVKKSLQSHNGAANGRDRQFWESHFRDGLFEEPNVQRLRDRYAESNPYKHAVIENIISDELLRGVRKEVLTEIHYTQKETDIYKIHQSGDLANLDGLDERSLAQLPNLLKLRDALYSPAMRRLLEDITQCGKLSGEKTDMAINVYTPGSHLLCHDDVIGSRRISYILYLTDPDDPWREQWGGALRLFPTKTQKGKNGKLSHIPLPDTSLSIFPQWNQLSFFAVQPGFSFHDVGEVFENVDAVRAKQPMRVAISGWFHIPQPGEDGFIQGQAEALQKESSLTTLQSSDERFDFPRPNPSPYVEYDPRYLGNKRPPSGKNQNDVERAQWEKNHIYALLVKSGKEDPNSDIFTAEEASFLLEFINPIYLDPDQVETMNSALQEDGQIVIEKFFRQDIADFFRHEIYDHFPRNMPDEALKIEKEGDWWVAVPPHKHRYLILDEKPKTVNALQDRLNLLFRGAAFRKWLQFITNCVFKSHDTRIRRFRRGQDYQLAKLYKEEQFRVEITLGLTPAGKWEAPQEDEDEGDGDEGEKEEDNSNGAKAAKKQTPSATSEAPQVIDFEPLSTAPATDQTNNGGYEMFITGDEDEDDAMDEDGGAEAEQPPVGKHSHLDVTGKQKKKKADPAVYKASHEDDNDDVMVNMAAGFNRLSIVMRDKGIMRFVKYVSKRSGCDRWDLTGEFEIDMERSARVFGWDDDGDGGGDEE